MAKPDSPAQTRHRFFIRRENARRLSSSVPENLATISAKWQQIKSDVAALRQLTIDWKVDTERCEEAIKLHNLRQPIEYQEYPIPGVLLESVASDVHGLHAAFLERLGGEEPCDVDPTLEALPPKRLCSQRFGAYRCIKDYQIDDKLEISLLFSNIYDCFTSAQTFPLLHQRPPARHN